MECLKAGRYYSTQGPELRGMILDGGQLRVETSEAYAISLTTGGNRWQSGAERHGDVGQPNHGSGVRSSAVAGLLLPGDRG